MQLGKLLAILMASMSMVMVVVADGRASPAIGCVSNQFCCVVSCYYIAVNSVRGRGSTAVPSLPTAQYDDSYGHYERCMAWGNPSQLQCERQYKGTVYYAGPYCLKKQSGK